MKNDNSKSEPLAEVKSSLKQLLTKQAELQAIEAHYTETEQRRIKLEGTVDFTNRDELAELGLVRTAESLFPARINAMNGQVDAAADELYEICNMLVVGHLNPRLTEQMRAEESRLADEFGSQAAAALRMSKRAREIQEKMDIATVRPIERERIAAHAQALIALAENVK